MILEHRYDELVTFQQQRSMRLFTMVHRVWWNVAWRFMWRNCWPLKLRSLFVLPQSRQMEFAGVIRILTLRGCDNDFLSNMARLDFRSLKNLSLLEDARDNPSLINNGMLSSLMPLCSKITTLCINEAGSPGPSDRRRLFTRFLATMDHLKDLRFTQCGRTVQPFTLMSPEAFEAILLYKNLESLELAHLTSDLLPTPLESEDPSHEMFPKLRNLKLHTTARVLQSLLPYITQVEQLHLIHIRDSGDIFPILAKPPKPFSNLETFELGERLYDEEFSIKGDDLVSFALNGPNLRVLNLVPDIGSPDSYRPMECNADDGHIAHMARYLPHLEHFYLDMNESRITGASMMTFGEFCPELDRLSLTLKINDWEALLDPANAGVWPDLTYFYCDGDTGITGGTTCHSECVLFGTWVDERHLELMPNLLSGACVHDDLSHMWCDGPSASEWFSDDE